MATAQPKISMPVFPACTSRYDMSVHSNFMPRGNSRSARRCSIAIVCPELTPGAEPPLIAAAGYML